MSTRRKVKKRRPSSRPTPVAMPKPALHAADLVRIAVATNGTQFPNMEPLQILADGSSRALTRAESARLMVILTMFARTFALALPHERREELTIQLEDIFVDEIIDDLEARLGELGAGD